MTMIIERTSYLVLLTGEKLEKQSGLELANVNYEVYFNDKDHNEIILALNPILEFWQDVDKNWELINKVVHKLSQEYNWELSHQPLFKSLYTSRGKSNLNREIPLMVLYLNRS